MTETLIAPWRPEQRAAFGKAPVRFFHGLAQSPLFDDEALVRLLDLWPAELYDINLFDFDDDGAAILRTGVRGRLPGDKVLEGIKAGRMWIQLRRAESHYPALAHAVRAAFAVLCRELPGFAPVKLNAQLILSAPNAKVPFHADAPGVVLFHMRGRKRLWVYPEDEAHMPEAGMEAIALRQTTEDLPYRRDMDAAAVVFDLSPGEALAWPLHAPHRVENLAGFNVSVSVDYQTWASRWTNGAYYTNGVLRRLGVTGVSVRRTPMPGRAALWAASLALRKSGLVEDRISHLERHFELDGKPVTTIA